MLGASSLGSVSETSSTARARPLAVSDPSRRGRARALVSTRRLDDDPRPRSRKCSFANRGHPYVEAGFAFPQSVQDGGKASKLNIQTSPDSTSKPRLPNAVATAARAVSSASEHVRSARARETATHSAVTRQSVNRFVARVIM
jgi:hypothetical protein